MIPIDERQVTIPVEFYGSGDTCSLGLLGASSEWSVAWEEWRRDHVPAMAGRRNDDRDRNCQASSLWHVVSRRWNPDTATRFDLSHKRQATSYTQTTRRATRVNVRPQRLLPQATATGDKPRPARRGQTSILDSVRSARSCKNQRQTPTAMAGSVWPQPRTRSTMAAANVAVLP